MARMSPPPQSVPQPTAATAATAATAPRAETGFAHVAALAFVAARTVPGFGFSVSLVGGTAMAHATDELGGRRGLAAGGAAVIESVAILGPARLSGPGGQLVTAPLIGWLKRRGHGFAWQVAATALARGMFNLLTTALFIAIIAGGIDTYAGTYDATLGRIPGAPDGTAAALVGTAIGLALWALCASWLQVWVFQRANRRWAVQGGISAPGRSATPAAATGTLAEPPPTQAPEETPLPAAVSGSDAGNGRFDPRAVIAASAVAFVLLLLSTDPLLLAGVGFWLLIAWQLAPAPWDVLKPGLALASTLALGAFAANTIGGDGVIDGLEHAARGALLVLTATWMRGAAGSEGVREVARRLLGRASRFRSAGELRLALDALAGDRRMGEAIRGLIAELRAVEGDLVAMLDHGIDWVAIEASRFRPGPADPEPHLRYRPLDLLVLIGALLPVLTLAPG